jgi:S-adenosyl-L-methionine hydrolase (adenosine-forming)
VPTRRVVSFLSDYGLADEFAGVCRSVILSVAPDVQVVDITHEVPAHDVRAGALTLVRSVQYLPDDGIVLAVVDPGVATERRLVGVAAAGMLLFGPDNGLLAPAVAMLGGASAVVSLNRPEYRLPAPGPTFAGRDVLAPAVGYAASGVALSDLGDPVDPAGLVPGLLGLPTVNEDGTIDAEVLWIDRFGNCQLNVGPEDLGDAARSGTRVQVRWADQARTARVVGAYADAKESELVLLVDSYGLLSLALDRRSAAEECRLRAGAAVRLVPPRPGQEDGS